VDEPIFSDRENGFFVFDVAGALGSGN